MPWGPHQPSPGSHALRDRPAPPPGPAPSNPLRRQGKASRGPASGPPQGRGVSPRPNTSGRAGQGRGRGRGGRGPAPTGCRAPGRQCSVRGGGGGGGAGIWRRAVLLGRTHRRPDGRSERAQALDRRTASRSEGRTQRVGRRRPPGRCAGAGQAWRGPGGRAAGPERAAGSDPERSVRRDAAGARASRSGKFAAAAALGGRSSSQGGKGEEGGWLRQNIQFLKGLA